MNNGERRPESVHPVNGVLDSLQSSIARHNRVDHRRAGVDEFEQHEGVRESRRPRVTPH